MSRWFGSFQRQLTLVDKNSIDFFSSELSLHCRHRALRIASETKHESVAIHGFTGCLPVSEHAVYRHPHRLEFRRYASTLTFLLPLFLLTFFSAFPLTSILVFPV